MKKKRDFIKSNLVKNQQQKKQRETQLKMEVSPFLSSLLNAEFNTTHMRDKNLEKAYFCVDCAGNSLTKKEMDESHSDHNVFRSRKNSDHYCYLKSDILSLGSEILDVTGIGVYNINKKDVYFLRTRKPVEMLNLRGNLGSCFNCGCKVIKPALFCSLLCKVECKDNPMVRMTMDEQNVGLSFKERNKKRKRGEEKNAGENSRVSLKLKHGGKTVILGNQNKRVVNEVKLVDVVAVAEKMTFRKRSRKWVPKRAPFF